MKFIPRVDGTMVMHTRGYVSQSKYENQSHHRLKVDYWAHLQRKFLLRKQETNIVITAQILTPPSSFTLLPPREKRGLKSTAFYVLLNTKVDRTLYLYP